MRVKTLWLFSYVVFLALVFAALVFFHQYDIFAFLVILLVLPTASAIFAHHAAKRVTVAMASNLYVTNKLTDTHIEILLSNPLQLPLPACGLRLTMSNRFYPNEDDRLLSFALYSGEVRQSIRIPVRSIYCGAVHVRLKEFVLHDYFNFFAFSVPLDVSSDVMALPKADVPALLDEVAGSYGEEESEERQNRIEDPNEVKDMREYRMGDRPQSIHWKLSAGRGELLVKEFESLSSRQHVLLFELYNDEGHLLDSILELVYALATQLIATNVEWKVLWWSESHYAFRDALIRSEEDLWDIWNDVFYETIYSEPFYAYELLKHRETKFTSFIYIAKANTDVAGRELASLEDASALLVIE